ncbi:MAG: hypothetical protein ACJ8DZ_13770 [Allosphingosinicella sp.]
MSGGRTILLLGGKSDGRRVTVLYGNSVIMTDLTGGREIYEIVELEGTTLRFSVGVIHGHHMDGDWIMGQLLAGYRS